MGLAVAKPVVGTGQHWGGFTGTSGEIVRKMGFILCRDSPFWIFLQSSHKDHLKLSDDPTESNILLPTLFNVIKDSRFNQVMQDTERKI